jgi:nitrogen fixation protein FixH
VIVDNVHVAGQKFNAKAAEGRAQAALGWKPELVIADGRLSYRLADAQGRIVPATQATVSFRRPAYAAEDHEATLARQPDGSLAAPVDLRDGLWIVEIRTEAGLERPYRDVRRLQMRGGVVQ